MKRNLLIAGTALGASLVAAAVFVPHTVVEHSGEPNSRAGETVWTPHVVSKDWRESPPERINVDDAGPSGVGLLPVQTRPAVVHPL